VDYVRPIEALIPGVQGRVLGVLARTSADLTMRAVADLAQVSPQQASVVIGRLVELGVVRRRDVPPASLVRLATENLAAQAVMSIAHLRRAAIEYLRQLAADIAPAPASLVVFGSFARGEAGPESDVDVLVVRPVGLSGGDQWTDSLGHWTDSATRALGNPVNLIEVGAEEIPALLTRKGPSIWQEAAQEGILLAGAPLSELAKAA
jgi:predicted nucleotidyltransferase